MILTYLIQLVTTAAVVAFALSFFLRSRGNTSVGPGWILMLAAFFALSDLYLLPAVSALDAELVIGNESLRAFLDVPARVPLLSFMLPGAFDLIGWLTQAALASWITNRLSRRPMPAARAK